MFSDILQRFQISFGAVFLYIVLKWQLVNTPSFIMPACVVEVFKTSVLQLAPRYFVPRAALPLSSSNRVNAKCRSLRSFYYYWIL